MADTPQPPRSVDEVLDWLEEGRVSPAEAFALFRDLERRGAQETKRPVVVKSRPPTTPSASERSEESEAERRKRLKSVLDELDRYIGLDSVKVLVREVQAFVEIQQRRSQARLA